MDKSKVTRTFFRHFRWKEEVIVEADSHDEAIAKAQSQFSSKKGSPIPDNAIITSDGSYDGSAFLPNEKENSHG